MTYHEINTTNGIYLVNFDLVFDIVRTSAKFQSQAKNMRIIKDDIGLLGKFSSDPIEIVAGVLAPTLYRSHIDYLRAKQESGAAVKALKLGLLIGNWYDMKTGAIKGSPDAGQIEAFRTFVLDYERKGRVAKNSIVRFQQLSWDLSKAGVESSIGRLEKAGVAAQWTRDASANILLTYAATLTGGAAFAWAGAGAMMKGVGKYQDIAVEEKSWTSERAIAAGTITASLSFVTAVIPAPASARQSEATAVILVKKGMEYTEDLSIGLIEGKSLRHAGTSAMMEAIFGVAGDNLPPIAAGIALKSNIVRDGMMAMIGDKIADPITEKLYAEVQASAEKKSVATSDKQKKEWIVDYTSPFLVHNAIIGPVAGPAKR